MKGVACCQGSRLPPSSGGPLIEVGEELTFRKVLQPGHHLGSHVVHDSLILSLLVPRLHGPAHAVCRFFHGRCADAGVLGTQDNVLNELQARCDVPPDVGVQLGDAFR